MLPYVSMLENEYSASRFIGGFDSAKRVLVHTSAHLEENSKISANNEEYQTNGTQVAIKVGPDESQIAQNAY